MKHHSYKTMLLRPRDHRLDPLLRRPFRAQGASRTPFICPPDSHFQILSGENWGFTEYLHLQISSDEVAIVPGEVLYRPSHTTLFAKDDQGALQITEDKFITHNDTLVCVLSLRNAGEFAVPVEIEAMWQVKKQEGMHRQAPPFDDLVQTLAPDSNTTLVFALAFHPDTDVAWKRAVYWQGTPSPVRQQQERWERWAQESVVRFDCPDPWLVRLWYHESSARFCLPFAFPSDRPTDFNAQAGFAVGDFDQLLWPPPPAHAAVFSLLELEITDEAIALNPTIDWPYFCLDGLPLGEEGGHITLVWDDTNAPLDAYDDGDKGLSLYINGRKKHHQEGLEPFRFTF
jgi:hypothetical protein